MEDQNHLQDWTEYARAYLGDSFWNEIMTIMQTYSLGFPQTDIENAGKQSTWETKEAKETKETKGPRIDLFQTTHDLIACVEVPGIEHVNEIDVRIDGQTLLIAGRLRTKYPKDLAILSERCTGRFERHVHLPVPILKDAVTAKYAHGLLEIRMPIIRQPKQKKIRVE
ncbi:Hsp20/alpha crystallin family protein [Fodinisporobacter ferrooxydans]|uniref:Hsp20/alpha crystallin family protein n=1 Tax=Fodinisporobacter ferrooxydans TaxID=2901836 RepID=A0ABY4CIZ6_9BACL|nr:Hsp20/alpha crystallin family protein [Alicyclobacillaceae bacterium MYW30-H2]